MSHSNGQKISIHVFSRQDLGKETRADVEVVHLSVGQRAVEALKTFGMFFGGAVVCVFIPVLHFVLVPTALLVGFIMAYRKFFQLEFVKSGTLTCPGCKHQFPVVQGVFNWPKREGCPSCDLDLMLER